MAVRNISCAETAKLVRAAVKRAFPGIKFSVQSETYSMGAAVNVSWNDGPSKADVRAVTQPYAGGTFNSAQDLMGYHDSWLLPDGAVSIDPALISTAERVRFTADFVSLHRSNISEAQS